jgi:hypothetical protein
MKISSENNNRQNEGFQRGQRSIWPLVIDIVHLYTAQSKADEQRKQNDIALRTARWTMVTAWGTVGAAILAFVAACIFYRQWGTMQAQLDEQRADFQIDQRTWIGIDTIDAIPRIPAIGQTFSARIGIKNSGKTPARLVTIVGHLDPIAAPMTLTSTITITLSISPEQSFLMQVAKLRFPLCGIIAKMRRILLHKNSLTL